MGSESADHLHALAAGSAAAVRKPSAKPLASVLGARSGPAESPLTSESSNNCFLEAGGNKGGTRHKEGMQELALSLQIKVPKNSVTRGVHVL